MPKSPVVAAGSGSGAGNGSSNKLDMNGEKFLVQNWSTTYHTIAIGGNDISFVSDPFASNGDNNTVLQLNYPKGSYVPSMGPVAGGTHFYATPFGDQTPFAKMMVSYDVAFPNGFDWVLGGKLPGIYGGSPYDGCSGGMQSTGENCLTARLMWRQSGLGEVYAYIPADSKSSFCNNPEVMCSDKYGKSVGRGLIYFMPGKWTRLDMVMALNEPAGRQNGILQVYMNGNLVISMDNVPYRSTGMVGFQGLMFSSFFGGSDPEYATPVDTSVYFRNVQLSVGEPAQLYNGTGGNASGRVVGSRGIGESVFFSLFALFMVLVLA
ncbi:hypothetical protein BG011_008967 [Mortierella polycephala]|uniref:Polysaccharide lyase 14 domain-containing protein n=1 Tax=Mortierella polycephala TaxID=41804 RepID=A0A9P6U869_9FUNG|nr:hypothetical protein BG011_008967 [Mortierella polycephala]